MNGEWILARMKRLQCDPEVVAVRTRLRRAQFFRATPNGEHEFLAAVDEMAAAIQSASKRIETEPPLPPFVQ